MFSTFEPIFSKCNEVTAKPRPCDNPDVQKQAANACYLLIDPTDAFSVCSKIVNTVQFKIR